MHFHQVRIFFQFACLLSHPPSWHKFSEPGMPGNSANFPVFDQVNQNLKLLQSVMECHSSIIETGMISTDRRENFKQKNTSSTKPVWIRNASKNVQKRCTGKKFPLASYLKLAYNTGIKTKSFYSNVIRLSLSFLKFFSFDYYFHPYHLESIYINVNEVSNDYLNIYTCTLYLNKPDNLRTVFYVRIIWTHITYDTVVIGFLNWWNTGLIHSSSWETDQLIVNIWSKVWQKSRFDRFRAQIISRNWIKFCHIHQHCQKICPHAINDHCSLLSRGKVCLAKDWILYSCYFFFAASSFCFWRWSLIIPHFFNQLNKSFHDRNLERSARLF